MSAQPASEPGVSMLIAAKWWASHGHLVFPLHNPVPTAEGLACSCGSSPCGSDAKHPRTPNGLKDATSDLEQITAWWTRWPNANIGITTEWVVASRATATCTLPSQWTFANPPIEDVTAYSCPNTAYEHLL